MGLTQHVTGPMHKDGHTLDLIITRSFDRVVSTKPVIDTYVSDHASILCDIDCCKPAELKENVSFRKLKSSDFDVLRDEVTSSVLCTGDFSDLEELVTCYNSTLTKLLDAHALVMTKTVVKPKCVPWFSNDIRLAIRSRRAAERKWRKSNLAQDYLSFKNARNRANYIMSTARKDYFSDLISQNSTNQAKLCQSVKTLLCEPCKTPFPPDVSPKILANDFGKFFEQKIEKIYKTLDMLSANEEPAVQAPRTAFSMPLTLPAVKPLFTSFKPVSEEDVRALITKAPIKCCPLDPIPYAVLAQLLDVLIPVITTMINLSFETGQFASDWKEALLLPSLKKAGLEVAFKNFHPISNLPFVSKLSEREAADQLMQHAVDQGLDCKFQSAYKKHHSTETALLNVKNDLLMNMDNRHVTLLVLLDLSSAFDTVSHDILLDHFNTRFGVSGIALQWLQSYLADRSQRVSINGVLSDGFELRHGVPQGSCLGPLLFSWYTSKLFDITRGTLLR